jgi:drug/metabolite transporter (DMT)-like permease
VSNDKNKNTFAVFGLLFGACFWGVIWYPYRLIEEAGISGVASSFYTYMIALAIASVFYAKRWRGIFDMPISVLWLSLLSGWTNLSYVLAVIDGQVMRVLLLFYLSPLWTTIWAHFWLKERINKRGLLTIVFALLGALIMLHDATGKTGWLPVPRSASDWLALSSGVGFSLANVISRKTNHLSVVAKSFGVMTGVILVTIFCIPFLSKPFPNPQSLSANNWFIMCLIAIVIVFGTLLVQFALTQIEANRVSVIFLFELIIAAIASYYLAGEVMTIYEWVGGTLIILAAIAAATNNNTS